MMPEEVRLRLSLMQHLLMTSLLVHPMVSGLTAVMMIKDAMTYRPHLQADLKLSR
jgi:hypothetical protein